LSIELNPVGIKCNLQCPYCYEEPMRDAGNFSPGYDLDAMKRGLERENYRFSLFGGEPLLMPIADLEEIFRWGLARFGSNGIQTNGALITDDHLRIFQQYQVGVGISLDGPDALNDVRWAGTLEKTRAATRASETAILRLCQLGVPPSLIITLHQGNAVGAKLHRLKAWIRELVALGVVHVRLHLLEVESPAVRAQWALTENENVAALLDLKFFQAEVPGLRFDLFRDLEKLLLGQDSEDGGTTCIWNACDPYTTRAVRGVNGIGESINCGRTNKDGVDWTKADVEGFERQLILHETPQSEHGCAGCRYFVMCKGQCPGTAVDGDWRNRTEHCGVWMRLFDRTERELVAAGQVPLTRSPILPAVERVLLDAWAGGQNLSIQQAVSVVRGAPLPSRSSTDHGDHWDAPDGYQHSDGGLELHGDSGMTQMHGDSPHVDA
jgi:uncharacterized protein